MDIKYRYSNYTVNKDFSNTQYFPNTLTGKIESNECGTSSAQEETINPGGTFDFTDKCDGIVTITKWLNFTSSMCAEWTVYGNQQAMSIKGQLLAVLTTLFVAYS